MSATPALRLINLRLPDGQPAAITVSGGRIERVEPPARKETGLDLGGRLVTPGLHDVHTHLFMLGGMEAFAYERELLKDSLPLRTLRGAAHARMMLDHGFTTVRDVCTEGAGYADVALAAAVEAGFADGPRVFASGPGLGITGGYFPSGLAPGVCCPMGCTIVDGADAARREVRLQVSHGVRWIKVFADWKTRGGGAIRPTFARDELAAIVDEAGRRGVRVAAHALGDEGARHAVEHGVASIEHQGALTRPTLDLMAARGVFLVPTLAVFEARAMPGRERRKQIFGEARAAGVRIACGTDIGAYPHATGSLVELGLYLEFGMSPEAALATATSEAAALLGQGDAGALAPGMLADLCAWDGADLRAALTSGKPAWVMKGGAVVRTA